MHAAVARVLLEAVRWKLAAMPTSLSADTRELLSLEGEAGVLPSQVAAVSYRLAVKRQLSLTQDVLQTFLGK